MIGCVFEIFGDFRMQLAYAYLSFGILFFYFSVELFQSSYF